MRLSDLLSKSPSFEFKQVEPFLIGKKGNCGQKSDLNIGNVALNYYCKKCENIRTFLSQGKLACVFINKFMISIDCVVACNCGTKVEVWFLVESENDITLNNPKVRILKKSERLSEFVQKKTLKYGEYDKLLDKAERAYREEFGAGAIVYLRKIYESVTIKTAETLGINTRKDNGSLRPFRQLIEEVDSQVHIIPDEFSENRYQLFGELSDVVHGEYDEEVGLKKFEPLNRLVIGILENIRNKEEFNEAKIALGWSQDEG